MVVFSVLDHHIRRPDADRVIGVLLGNISDETGIVEIRNCFPVPHGEGEQVRPPYLISIGCLLSHCLALKRRSPHQSRYLPLFFLWLNSAVGDNLFAYDPKFMDMKDQ